MSGVERAARTAAVALPAGRSRSACRVSAVSPPSSLTSHTASCTSIAPSASSCLPCTRVTISRSPAWFDTGPIVYSSAGPAGSRWAFTQWRETVTSVVPPAGTTMVCATTSAPFCVAELLEMKMSSPGSVTVIAEVVLLVSVRHTSTKPGAAPIDCSGAQAPPPFPSSPPTPTIFPCTAMPAGSW